jgi:DNA-binding NarL/FixJ family response regulator
MPKRSTTLSSIELEILTDVARGLNNNQIGMKRFRSPETIRSEMKSIFAKLGARNRAHAVAIAYHTGIFHGRAPEPPTPERTTAPPSPPRSPRL